MALEHKLVQKLSQSLMMTPQLQQAIKLLQLGRLEYLEAIEKELLDNPLLEEIKEEDRNASAQNELPDAGAGESLERALTNGLPEENSSSTSETAASSDEVAPQTESKVDWEDYLEQFADSRGAATPKGLIDFEDRPSPDANITREESLADYLTNQIRLSDLSDTDRELAIYLVGNLDRNGYLGEDIAELARQYGCPREDIERCLQFFRSLDPPGVGARDLKECLIIQLEHLGLGDGLAARIIQAHLDKLEKKRFDLIAKSEQVAIEEVYKAVSAIRQLEPRPGRSFSDESARYIVPDIYVYKVGNEYVISLNEDGLPKLRVSPYYLQLLKNNESENLPNKTYLNERLKAASWLIRSIHQRQQTIFKVTESIMKFQRDFLDYGISRLKPLVLKDVADDIGMHESTVSRVTTEKYVHTPQGVFELKYFFTTGIKTADGDVSSSTVKDRIKNIIAAESSDKPVSDQAIVEILKKESIIIARRTVAKYRESLGIESSSCRKKHF